MKKIYIILSLLINYISISSQEMISAKIHIDDYANLHISQKSNFKNDTIWISKNVLIHSKYGKLLKVDWKNKNETKKAIEFLNENLAEIGLSNFKLNTDTKNPRKLFLTVDKMPNKYFDIYSIDNTVISLAFSQLFLTGNIEPEIKKLAKIAIEREILFADVWEENSKTRIEKLNKLTKSLNLAE